jgi:hypothetical protein
MTSPPATMIAPMGTSLARQASIARLNAKAM